MTFDERFSLLQAAKPLPLIAQPAVRFPGPIQTAITEMFLADRWIAINQRRFAAAQRRLQEITHATPANP